MAFYPGQRVQLSEAGVKQRWGESYRQWTGTVQCDCAPYTVSWDQGSRSNHDEWEIQLVQPPAPPDPLEGTPKRMKPFYAGVRSFTKAVEEAKT